MSTNNETNAAVAGGEVIDNERPCEAMASETVAPASACPQVADDAERCLAYAHVLSSLIQIETVSTDTDKQVEKFRAYHGVLERTFPHIFAACEKEDFDGSLLLRWPGRNTQTQPVCFMNHMDVVEPNGPWGEHGAFSGDIADGRVWGRGTLDTTTGLWGMLTAADELAAEGFVPACDVYFESSNSEEVTTSGCDEISQELERRGIRFRFTLDEGGYILHDPLGGADGDFAMVGVGEKSLVSLKFIAKADGGHASTPGKDTALVRLGRFMADADKQAKAGKLFPVKLNDVITEMLRRMAPTMTGALGKVFAHPDVFKPVLKKVMPEVSATAGALMRTTIAFTEAKGSDGYNVLPTEAWVVANIRCSHHQGKAASVAAITNLARKYNLDVETVEETYESRLSSFDNAEFRLLESAISEMYPGTIASPYIMTGASDSRFMDCVCDKCFRICPFFVTDEQVATIHAPNENINVDTLAKGVDVYKRLMQTL